MQGTKLTYLFTRDIDRFYQILDLQSSNLPQNLKLGKESSDGFLTVEHTVQDLQAICGNFGHVIALADDVLIGYVLVMLKSARRRLLILEPMFDQIDGLTYNDESMATTPYVVMGQVCIAEEFRGKGVFSGLYKEMSTGLSAHFDYIITEIDGKNFRSIRAHQKVGFQHLHTYSYPADTEWEIIILPILRYT